MKKTCLKAILTSFLLLGSTSLLISCSDNDDNGIETIIPEENLPSNAKTFLSTFFYDVKVVKVEQTTQGSVVVYEVDLENGYDVVFNAEGEWVEVDAPDGMTIPSGIAPQVIENYLDTNYPGYGINEINRTGVGYHVELTNGQGGDGIELNFNEAGEVVGMPSMS